MAQNSYDLLAQKFSEVQEWKMSAPLNTPKPDCVETWTFRTDGTLTVDSGKERVQKKWRLGDDEGKPSLFMQRISSTGGADCLGNDSRPFDELEPENKTPLWLLSFRGGDSMLLCNPEFVKTDQSAVPAPFYGDNCWGRLEPAE